jgi:hypothetical protein
VLRERRRRDERATRAGSSRRGVEGKPDAYSYVVEI